MCSPTKLNHLKRILLKSYMYKMYISKCTAQWIFVLWTHPCNQHPKHKISILISDFPEDIFGIPFTYWWFSPSQKDSHSSHRYSIDSVVHHMNLSTICKCFFVHYINGIIIYFGWPSFICSTICLWCSPIFLDIVVDFLKFHCCVVFHCVALA